MPGNWYPVQEQLVPGTYVRTHYKLPAHARLSHYVHVPRAILQELFEGRQTSTSHWGSVIGDQSSTRESDSY